MCQVLPFTLPCCRRTYVEVSKLPSCPDAWPEKKCPPELCIQVRYDAEDRDNGTCWRCQANISGILGEARENLRPEIDSAMIVHGLDELGVSGRRKIAEEGGTCWYCGAKAGCQYCAPIKDEFGTEQEKPDDAGKKRRREVGRKTDKAISKRIKVEPRDTNQPPSLDFSHPHLQPPQHLQQWQNVFSAPYTNMPFSPGYGFTQESNMTGSDLPWSQPFLPQPVIPGMVSVDWAEVHNENSSQVRPEQKSSQSYTSLTSAVGRQGDALSYFPPYQFQYPDPDSAFDVKPVVQPKVKFEYPSQMDEATLVHFLDSYSNQFPNVAQQPSQPQVPLSAQGFDQQGDGGQHCTKVEQPFPST
ncbi:hypothetical protein N431DRAFT_48143 [Stipitochalara longipes BDJ]|nr:hypothetical protein N431DRAFT_48143 [Stipitochalara longipes BDJ]